MTKTLFVYPLDSATLVGELARKFEKFGAVESVRIYLAGLHPKFALIQMVSEGGADEAATALNGREVVRTVSEVVAVGTDPELFGV